MIETSLNLPAQTVERLKRLPQEYATEDMCWHLVYFDTGTGTCVTNRYTDQESFIAAINGVRESDTAGFLYMFYGTRLYLTHNKPPLLKVADNYLQLTEVQEPGDVVEDGYLIGEGISVTEMDNDAEYGSLSQLSASVEPIEEVDSFDT